MNKLELTENKYLGKLIVFEGVDGAGKTTMISLTYQYLKEKYPDRNIVLLKQPSERARNSELFKKMMFDKDHEDINYRAVQLLTLSDRIQQNSEIVIPLLKDNAIIIVIFIPQLLIWMAEIIKMKTGFMMLVRK